MKASEIAKVKWLSRAEIDKMIMSRNERGYHAIYISEDKNVLPEVYKSLIEDGFTVTKVGNPHGMEYKIEWLLNRYGYEQYRRFDAGIQIPSI